MKTVILYLAGMADIPDKAHGWKTPLMEARTNAMDILATDIFGEYYPFKNTTEFSEKTALMSFLGYDCAKGIPSDEELMECALNNFEVPSLDKGYMIIPMFSGHGSIVSHVSIETGIGKLALLETEEVKLRNLSIEEGMVELANRAIGRIHNDELVLVNAPWPYLFSCEGDFDRKKEVIEMLDELLVNPVADYIWHSPDCIQLCITSGFTASWRERKIMPEKTPFSVYMNDITPLTDSCKFSENTAKRSNYVYANPESVMQILLSRYRTFDISELPM